MSTSFCLYYYILLEHFRFYYQLHLTIGPYLILYTIAECILNIGGGVFSTHLKLTDTAVPYTITVWGSQHCALRLLVMGGGGAGHYGGGGSGFIRGSS